VSFRVPSVACALAVLAAGAVSQDYWPLERVAAAAAADRASAGWTLPRLHQPQGGSLAFTANDPLAQFSEAAGFLVPLQVVGGIESGGMREGEDQLFIVQSDNTAESIWVWSRYRQLTGSTVFDPNVAAAWGYLANFPGWLEEGGAGPFGYYRVYNCAWGLVCEMLYRQVTGDASKLGYANVCANYIQANPLSLAASDLNVQVSAWAAAALYDFAVEQGNAAWKASAAALGNAVRIEAEADPALLATEQWAMSGGTVLYGVLHSWFRENAGGRAWALAYGPLAKSIDEAGEWRLSHTAWYALGKHEAWEASGSSALVGDYRVGVDFLVTTDGDDDGGIPPEVPTAVNGDHSWATSYLAYMGFERRIVDPDGALADDVVTLASPGTWDLSIGVTNHDQVSGRTYLAGLDVLLPGGAAFPLVPAFALPVAPQQILYVPSYPVIVPPGVPAGIYQGRLTLIDAASLAMDVELVPVTVP
jgi:hypothetical protein